MVKGCSRCGKCCLEWFGALDATPEDITQWVRGYREDILQYIQIDYKHNGKPKYATGHGVLAILEERFWNDMANNGEWTEKVDYTVMSEEDEETFPDAAWEYFIDHLKELMGIEFDSSELLDYKDEHRKRCPFVRKVRGKRIYRCTIYELRPTKCLDYTPDPPNCWPENFHKWVEEKIETVQRPAKRDQCWPRS